MGIEGPDKEVVNAEVLPVSEEVGSHPPFLVSSSKMRGYADPVMYYGSGTFAAGQKGEQFAPCKWVKKKCKEFYGLTSVLIKFMLNQLNRLFLFLLQVMFMLIISAKYSPNSPQNQAFILCFC